MPSLSERDLRSVEKLFNAMQPILLLSLDDPRPPMQVPHSATERQNSSSLDSRMSSSVLSPSVELQEGLSVYSASRANTTSVPSSMPGSAASANDAATVEKRLWMELAFAVWRVGQQKLHLMNFVAIDPLGTLSTLACRLAEFLKSVYSKAPNRLARLLAIAQLSSNHVVTLLQLFCSRKTCVAMLNGDTNEGTRLHEAVCQYLTDKGHFSWLSQLYVNFCDEAAERDASTHCMPTTIVVALREILECLRICAEQSKIAANAFITAEPVAYVTYMFYGLKLRISRGALLRPHESGDVFWLNQEAGVTDCAANRGSDARVDDMARVALDAFRAVGIPVKRSSASIVPSKYFSRIVRADLVRSMEAFQEPASSSGDSSERKVTESMKEMLRATIPEASSACQPLTPAECAHLRTLSAPIGGSSSALNRGGLSRAQLHQLIAFGRLNCFDELMHHALDVMVEAVRTTRSYSHFAIHSILGSYFNLSVRGMESLAGEIHSRTTHGADPGVEARRDIASRFLTPLLALYENVITIGHAFLALAENLNLASEAGSRLDSTVNSTRRAQPDSSGDDVAPEDDVRSQRELSQAVEQLQEDREQFMQHLLKDEHTMQLRTVIYTVPNLLRADPMLFAIMEEMCRLGAVTHTNDTVFDGNTSINAASRQGSRYGGYGSSAPGMRRTPNASFQKTDAAGGGAAGRPPLAWSRAGFGSSAVTNTSMAMGSFFFGPHQGGAASPLPAPAAAVGDGSGARRRRLPPVPTRAQREGTPSSPPKDTNFAKSFFKSFFGRKGPSSSSTGAADQPPIGAVSSHGSQLLDSSNPNVDPTHARPLFGGGMGPSRPSLAEFDELMDDAADGDDRRLSPHSPGPLQPQARWSEVLSYVTLVRSNVELFLLVLDDSRLNVYVRIAAGLVLSSVTFADTNSFDLYEGRVGVRAMLLLIMEALHNAKIGAPSTRKPTVTTTTTAGRSGTTPSSSPTSRRHGQREDDRTTTAPNANGGSDSEELIPTDEVRDDLNDHDELTSPELISLVTKVLHLLKKVYFVLGVAPLTSETVLLTDLPLSFFAESETAGTAAAASETTHTNTDGDPTDSHAADAHKPASTSGGSPHTPHDAPAAPLDLKLKRLLEATSFEDVLQLWSNAVDAADCDEDMDAASFKVLEQLFQRALQRGSLPRSTRGATTSAGAGANSNTAAGAMGASTAGTMGASTTLDPGASATSQLTVTDVRRAAGSSSTTRRPPLTPLSCAPSGMVTFLNNSLFDDSEAYHHEGYPGSPTFTMGGAGGSGSGNQAPPRGMSGAAERRLLRSSSGTELDALGENKSAEMLVDVFDNVVHRSSSLLTATSLRTLFSLFACHDTALVRIGRHCLITSFDCGDAYDAYAKLIRDGSDVDLIVKLLALMSRNLQSEDMTEERFHERRTWLFRSHFINELILRLCATLKAPHLTPLFVRFVPQAFRLLCAFEPSRETPPHLDDTCFLAAVSESIATMEGAEYFLIVAQSVIDAATSSFDSVSTYLTGQSAALMTRPLHIMHGKWYAEKQTFLDLVPALASWTLAHDLGLYQCLVEVVTGILQCTSNVNSSLLVDFALSNGLAQWVPYLEMPPDRVSQIPLAGDPTYLRHFWTPVLANAPQRSDIRYAMTGGVRLSVGRWPERGFSITALFKFDAVYPTIPLFQLQSNETAEMAERPIVVEIVGGDSVQLACDGYRTTLNESHALQNFRAGKWMPVTLVFSVANTVSTYIGGFKIGTASAPYFEQGTTATVNVGFVNRSVPMALFSLGDITMWDDELTAGQVEAHLAFMCFSEDHGAVGKVPEFAIPYTLGRRDATAPVDDCIAHYVPYEHSEGLLTNLLNTENRYPLLAKIVGRNAVTPQYWVDYYQLFISRAGAYHLLDWLRRCTTTDEVVETVQLLMEAMRRANSSEMERPFLYLRLAHHLKQVAPLITPRVWDAVLYGATSHVVINDEEHRIAINRYLFEFVLGNMEVHNEVDDSVTLYLLERLEKVFNPSTCRYAKHNARFIYPVRFVDRLLNSLVLVANDTSLAVRAATIGCAKQVVVACDMEEALVHCLTSLVAELTPSAITMASRFSATLEVSLPIVRHVRTTLSVLTAQNLTTLILHSLVECAALYTGFMTAFCRVIDFNWYAVCLSRFADPVAVIYATKLFFEAVQRSPSLLEQAMQHQATIVEALQPHAIHDDLTLFLLSLTIGCSRNVDLLAQNHSLLQQLDGVLNSCTPEPSAVVAPIFVKIFVCHLSAVVRHPHFLPYPVNTVHQRHRYNAYRIRKYFRLAFFCCRMMLLINLKRYRTTLSIDLRRLREQGSSPSHGPRRQPSEVPPLEASVSGLDATQSGSPGLGLSGSDFTAAVASTTPVRTPAQQQQLQQVVSGFDSPRRSQNHSFTLSFAGGPSTLYAPRMPPTMSGNALTPAAADRRSAPGVPPQNASFLTVPGMGSAAAAAALSTPHPRSGSQNATNSSFASEGTGSFANPPPSRPRVRSNKWKRAFAALRVCVLLWIPLQCRRYRWVFLRKQVMKPEQTLQHRHPGTLFSLRALRRFSAQPSLFYVLVSSPLETAALATLLPYISKDRLAERTQAWTEYLHKIGPSALHQAAAQQQQLHSSGAGSPTTTTFVSNKLIAESETRSNASSDTMTTTPTSVATQGRQSSFPVARLPDVAHSVSTNALSDKAAAATTSSPLPEKAPAGAPADVAHDTSPLPQPPHGATPVGSPHQVTSLGASFADSFANVPPSVDATAMPERRKLVRPSIQVPPSAPLGVTSSEGSPSQTRRPAGDETRPQSRTDHPTRGASAHSHSNSTSRSGSDDDDDDDDGGSSNSSSSSSSSSSSTGRGSSLGTTLRDTASGAAHPVAPAASSTPAPTPTTEEVPPPSMLISESTLFAMTEGHDGTETPERTPSTTAADIPFRDLLDLATALPGTHVPQAEVAERVIASVGEGVRKDTVSILSCLIRASLNVLPAQRWIGGPSYGSCGGLLFQLMFISSAATSSDDLSATLVRFFLVEVTTCVHEQQVTVDPAAMRVGSPLIPSLSNSLVFDSARNSLSLRGVAAERGGFSGPGSAINNNSFPGSGIGNITGSANSSVHGSDLVPPLRAGAGGPGGGIAGANQNATSNSDVLLFNVSHFTELVVDMLSINVLDLMTARDYLHSLLVLCFSWPARFVDQLSSQVMRACVAVLNRPSQNDVPVEMIRTIYDLTKIVMRPHWHMKGMIECLLRVLYRVYTAFPPVYMSDEDAQLRKDLVVLIFRHIVQTYVGTKELHKALTVRTLTQRFSLYDAFKSTLLKGTDAQACAAFHAYCETHSSAMETLMSGRPRQKADAAFRTTIKIRTEYIKRIKSFSQYYMSEVELKPGYKPPEMVERYMGRYSSYTASVPRLLEEQLALIPIHNCSLPEMLNGDRFSFYHYMDMPRNFTLVPRPIQDKVPPLARHRRRPIGSQLEEDERHPAADEAHSHVVNQVGDEETPRPEEEDLPEAEMTARTRAPPLAEDLELRQASVCEEQVNHIAALVPAFAVRSRPFLSNAGERPPFIGENVVATPSAINLLWYLIDPDEVLRFMSNGFRINGLHATPCLILLTNRSLKVISFSRVTESGDIILCQNEPDEGDDDDAKSTTSSGVQMAGGADGGENKSGSRTKRKQGFNILSMTKQLQRFLTDGKTAEMKQRSARDGTRVAQAVRQSTSKAYSQLYWWCAARNMRQVRCLRYMHLNTAVLIKMHHDDGIFLSVVDSKQSMNPSVREEFLSVLRDVVRPHQCEFIDSSQRATDMRSMLIRWAAGSVSNYEYLAFLNRTAGRTVKDYNQYPVFPWVLADYVSPTLDLERNTTFRDFRFPMGAQLEERRDMVADLYQNTSEVVNPETGKSYPFHHGTHYSTSGGVLYFLLRAEPFTTFARDFQGGNFDVATRLFDSVAASFRSCELGPADCKELLPEFFYNNKFLLNADRLDFGCKSDGEKVDSVHLPPWAKGSVQVFTAVMRYALESDYVIHNIHHWIDLVFGVRRRGPLAVERFNVFQRMTYGEEVVEALQQAETPHDCDVIIAEVDNFGQTPLQLFQERHPSHMELEPVKKTSSKDYSFAGSLTNNSIGGASTFSSGGGGGVASPAPAGGGGGSSGAAGNANSASFAAPAGEFKPSALLKASYTAISGGGDARAGGRSGSLASGNTYTNAFKKETPKVMLMLVQSLAEPMTHFELSEPNPQMFIPLPPALVARYRVKPAVTGFERVEGTQKIACSYPYMVAVGDATHFVCWHEREGRMLRCRNTDGSFLSVVPFRSPDDRTVRVTAVAVSARESCLIIGVSSGSIYCFLPTLRDDRVVHASSLCFHRHAIRGIVVDAAAGRALSFTTDALDYPIVWRVQRCQAGWMHQLDLSSLLPPQESKIETDHDRTVVSASVDPTSLMSILATPRYLLLYDMNGEPFAGGKLPGFVVRRMPPPQMPPSSTAAALSDSALRASASAPVSPDPAAAAAGAEGGPIMLEEEDGTLGIAVSPVSGSSPSAPRAPLKPAPPPEPDMTCITVYQCTEWAGGMQLYVSGHIDGSIGLWRSTRLPPDTVQPGKIAVVEFHHMVIRGDGSAGAVTALRQDRPDVPFFFVGFADGSVKIFSFEEPSVKEDGVKSK